MLVLLPPPLVVNGVWQTPCMLILVVFVGSDGASLPAELEQELSKSDGGGSSWKSWGVGTRVNATNMPRTNENEGQKTS